MRFFLIILLLLVSCSKSVKKTEPTIKTINYLKLNSFVKDSLPIFLDLDSQYNQVFNLWGDIDVLKKASTLSKIDTRQLLYFIEPYSLEIDKINEIHIPTVLNTPSIIGRLRVFKTDVLKIDTKEDLNNNNLKDFKENLLKITDSYNALIRRMNAVAKESVEINN
ncbi:MAG: hypothetical protein O3C01_01160 [Bacteroidetes bacterium]|nr:hypothetical protein [Bacteroidota bacterium]MDA1019357.1 hypothetical protein [Bacteroidota bacterium]